MKSNIEKYINEEKQLAEYKIQLLKAGESKQYKNRLILKEEDFLNFDFSKITFSSLDEVREAILLFKSSREDFDNKYGDSKKKSLEKISNLELDSLNSKILFFEEKYKWILDKKVKEINVIDNKSIRSLVKNLPNLNEISIPQIGKIEGSIVGKYRARIQILLYCLARYFFTEIRAIKNSISNLNFITYSELKALDKKLYSLFIDYIKYIYQYFNVAKVELPSLLINTNGYNPQIDSIHSLKNIAKDIKPFQIAKITDKTVKVYDGYGNRINKKSSDRAYGINTNIKRVGNESIDIVYMDIYTEDFLNITHIFEYSFFNNYVKGEYFRSIPTIPIPDIIKNINEDGLYNNFISFFKEDSKDIDFVKINSGLVDPIRLSSNNSTILIAETRSDSEHLKDVEKLIQILVNSIKKEYEDKFNVIN
jgi:hypothetical protein